MSDDLADRINAQLDDCTPGPWRVRPGRRRTVEIVREYDGGSSWFIVVHQMHDGADAALIAAAPSLLAEARDEITRLNAHVEQLLNACDAADEAISMQTAQSDRLRALLDAPSTGEVEHE